MMPMLGAAGFANKAMREHASALIGDVGLTPWQDNLAGNLSGGQQQRVAVARALNPAIHVVVRTRYVSSIDELRKLGASEVLPELLAAQRAQVYDVSVPESPITRPS